MFLFRATWVWTLRFDPSPIRVLYSTLIYGLNVQLNEAIPGIAPSVISHDVDIEVHLGFLPAWFETQDGHQEFWYRGPNNDQGVPRLVVWKLPQFDCYHFSYADGTQFLVDSTGSEVWSTWPAATLTVEDAATYLLGPVMGFVLLLRGNVSLHASAVAICDSAVALVGPAGAGKSTCAAAFANLGYRVLTEDVLTLKEFSESFLVQPGYPCIRLWPDSVAALWGAGADLPRLTPTWDKRFLDLTQTGQHFEDRPLPLKAIYVIYPSRSDLPEASVIGSMSQRQALLALVANTYASYLMNKQMRATEFEILSRLLKLVKIQSLTLHYDPARIADLCLTIIQDFNSANINTSFKVVHV